MFWSLERVKNELVPEGNAQMKTWQERSAFDEQLFWYAPVTDVRMTDRWTHEFKSFPQVERWKEMRENEEFTLMEPGEASRVRVELSAFGRSFGMTRRYEQFGSRYESDSNVWSDLASWTEEFNQAGLAEHSIMMGGVLLNGFDASVQPMRDGSALIDSSHTDFPKGNYFTRQLSVELFEEVEQARYAVVGTGARKEPVIYNFTHIIVGPGKALELKTILNTLGQVNTANNNINPFYKSVQPVICPFFQEEYQEGASEYVYFVDAARTPLKGRVAYYPTYLTPWRKNPNLIEVPAETVFTYFALWSGGIAASDGTTTS